MPDSVPIAIGKGRTDNRSRIKRIMPPHLIRAVTAASRRGRQPGGSVMGRDKREKERRKERLPPFVPLLIDTLDQPAWRAMSHGAQMLYVALRRRYSPHNHNNGRLFLSQRTAEKELKSHHNEIARWFRELQHYGFIVLHTAGYLGADGHGQAPRWRLTELGYMRDAPTRDFTRWGGQPFKDTKQPRPSKRATLTPAIRATRKKQNPVREKQHGVCAKSGTPPCAKTLTLKAHTVHESTHKGNEEERA